MNIIAENKGIKGLCFRGNGQGWSSSPTLKIDRTAFTPIKVIYELDSGTPSNTTEYHYGDADTSVQFRLYLSSDILNPINYLPEHKFKIYSHQNIEVTSVSLVYDGNGLFHLEGSLGAYTFYGAKTVFGYVGYFVLEDSNGNLILTDADYTIFTSTTGAGSGETGTNAPYTLTISRNIENEISKESISLPFDMTTILTTQYPKPSDMPPDRYSVGFGNVASSYNVEGTFN